jgi:hypothetical protein
MGATCCANSPSGSEPALHVESSMLPRAPLTVRERTARSPGTREHATARCTTRWASMVADGANGSASRAGCGGSRECRRKDARGRFCRPWHVSVRSPWPIRMHNCPFMRASCNTCSTPGREAAQITQSGGSARDSGTGLRPSDTAAHKNGGDVLWLGRRSARERAAAWFCARGSADPWAAAGCRQSAARRRHAGTVCHAQEGLRHAAVAVVGWGASHMDPACAAHANLA